MADTAAMHPGVPGDPAGDDPSRRDFIHIAAAVGAAGAAVGVVWPLIDQMNPSADTLALSSIEYDLSKVALGEQVAIKWRGKPVFVRHRTNDEIKAAIQGDNEDMRDPQKDADRHKAGKDQWLILVGICTHLGCVPEAKKGDFGGTGMEAQTHGWLCPCHGSIYDTSGRIRKGPAPKNLEVPEYTFLSDTKVKIG